MHGEALPIAHRCGSSRATGGATAATSCTSGIVVLFAAFAGLAFKKDHDVTLRAGETHGARRSARASLDVLEPGRLHVRDAQPPRHRGGARGVARRRARRGSSRARSASTSTAARSRTFEPSTEVGIRRVGAAGRVRRARRRAGEETAEMRISFNPLVWWVWIGGIDDGHRRADRDVAAGRARAARRAGTWPRWSRRSASSSRRRDAPPRVPRAVARREAAPRCSARERWSAQQRRPARRARLASRRAARRTCSTWTRARRSGASAAEAGRDRRR